MLKEHAIEFVTKNARRLLTGPSTQFRLARVQTPTFPTIKKSGLYIHVPFCQQLCPYCPYNRIPYDADLARKYIEALLKEITFYSNKYPDLAVTSIYFGGGTPTVLGDGMRKIAQELHNKFTVVGPLCIETHPADLTLVKVNSLKSLGAHTISLGVQSFNQKFLDFLGRKYTPDRVERVLAWLEQAGFRAVNIDLLFALPGQTLKELEADLERATSTSADQITFYPLFTFPYSSVGQYRKLATVVMPKLAVRRRMYYFLYDYLTRKGYDRVSVWSFKRNPETPRYSSVTREYYVGFGPGAGSYYGSLFTLNTFSVPEYINSVNEKGHALALEMPFAPMLSIHYDFYWRVYDTFIPEKRQLDHLSYRVQDIKRLYCLLRVGELMGMVKKQGHHFGLTRRGTFWVHLMQNYFSLRSINTIWSAAQREAWPAFVNF